MKKVFEVKIDEKSPGLLSDKFTFHVFADNVTEAIKKVEDCMAEKMEVIQAELFCSVEEDSDLESYKEE